MRVVIRVLCRSWMDWLGFWRRGVLRELGFVQERSFLVSCISSCLGRCLTCLVRSLGRFDRSIGFYNRDWLGVSRGWLSVWFRSRIVRGFGLRLLISLWRIWVSSLNWLADFLLILIGRRFGRWVSLTWTLRRLLVLLLLRSYCVPGRLSWGIFSSLFCLRILIRTKRVMLILK